MERLRAAERAAKEKRAYLYANASTATPSTKAGGASVGSRVFEGTVVRVWSADQVSIAGKDGNERRVQLSSTRGPKCVVPLT